MKTTHITAIALTCIVFSACSDFNDYPSIQSFENVDYIEEESLLAREAALYDGWISSEGDNLFTSRASMIDATVFGYTSKTSSGNQKVLISTELASLMGISRQIYIVEYLTVYYDMAIRGLGETCEFIYASSPLCGVDPTSSGYSQRGYALSVSAATNKVRMTTKCVHVICDILGRRYDRWYPCVPLEVQWNYKLFNY